MTLEQAQTATTLAAAQATFRQSPSRATALAYMDAAITYHEACGALDGAATLVRACKEIRDWLMNERYWRDPALHPEGIESQ